LEHLKDSILKTVKNNIELTPIISGIIIACFTYYIYTAINSLYTMFDEKNIQMTTIGASFLISNISSSIVSAMSTIISKVINSFLMGPMDCIDAIKKEIEQDVKNKNDLPQQYVEIIKEILFNIKYYIARDIKESNYKDAFIYIEEVYPRIYDILMKFPIKAKDISHIECDSIINELPEENHDAIRSFLLHMKHNSIISKVNQRSILYLNGPPGTGKTVFAKKLATHFNLPMRSVNLVQFESKNKSILTITNEESCGGGDITECKKFYSRGFYSRWYFRCTRCNNS
jgi:ATP-dependent Lon protease